jgi:hypothetical protein
MAEVWATCWAELEHRIGYSHVMNRFDPTNAHAVPRSVALRDEVYAPWPVTGESIRAVGGRSVPVRIRPARASFERRASNGDARPDNRLAFMDHALFAEHRAIGRNLVVQCVVICEHQGRPEAGNDRFARHPRRQRAGI